MHVQKLETKNLERSYDNYMEPGLPYVVVIQKRALFRALSPQNIIPHYWFLYLSKYSQPWICTKKIVNIDDILTEIWIC